jgi:hypothetical protein
MLHFIEIALLDRYKKALGFFLGGRSLVRKHGGRYKYLECGQQELPPLETSTLCKSKGCSNLRSQLTLGL